MTALDEHYKGWNTSGHLETFDLWNGFSNRYFNYVYGSFAEQHYLNRAVRALDRPDILDVGCATGTTYRFLRNTNAEGTYTYRGVDLSEPAVRKSQSLYPGVDFSVKGQEPLMDYVKRQYDIVYSRDTVMHQTAPYTFLNELAAAARRFLVLRLRTRDKGETVTDVERSCQMHYEAHWMPYIVLNTDELIERIRELPNVAKVTLNRSYEVLGGHNQRFLPKDLYFQSTGGAETAVLIAFDPDAAPAEMEVVFDSFLEGHAYQRANRWRRYAYAAVNRIEQRIGLR